VGPTGAAGHGGGDAAGATAAGQQAGESAAGPAAQPAAPLAAKLGANQGFVNPVAPKPALAGGSRAAAGAAGGPSAAAVAAASSSTSKPVDDLLQRIEAMKAQVIALEAAKKKKATGPAAGAADGQAPAPAPAAAARGSSAGPQAPTPAPAEAAAAAPAGAGAGAAPDGAAASPTRAPGGSPAAKPAASPPVAPAAAAAPAQPVEAAAPPPAGQAGGAGAAAATAAATAPAPAGAAVERQQQPGKRGRGITKYEAAVAAATGGAALTVPQHANGAAEGPPTGPGAGAGAVPAAEEAAAPAASGRLRSEAASLARQPSQPTRPHTRTRSGEVAEQPAPQQQRSLGSNDLRNLLQAARRQRGSGSGDGSGGGREASPAQEAVADPRGEHRKRPHDGSEEVRGAWRCLPVAGVMVRGGGGGGLQHVAGEPAQRCNVLTAVSPVAPACCSARKRRALLQNLGRRWWRAGGAAAGARGGDLAVPAPVWNPRTVTPPSAAPPPQSYVARSSAQTAAWSHGVQKRAGAFRREMVLEFDRKIQMLVTAFLHQTAPALSFVLTVPTSAAQACIHPLLSSDTHRPTTCLAFPTRCPASRVTRTSSAPVGWQLLSSATCAGASSTSRPSGNSSPSARSCFDWLETCVCFAPRPPIGGAVACARRVAGGQAPNPLPGASQGPRARGGVVVHRCPYCSLFSGAPARLVAPVTPH